MDAGRDERPSGRWESVRLAVLGDRVEYLHRHAREGDATDHPYGLVHQSNLRAVAPVLEATAPDEVAALARRYFADAPTRAAVLSEARRRVDPDGTVEPMAAPQAEDVFLDIPTSRGRFRSLGRAPASTTVIDCDYGYGEFLSPSARRTPGGDAYERSGPDSEASLGAMMFYGCCPTQGSGMPFIQELPLEVFCATVSAVPETTPQSGIRCDWTTLAASREASDLAARADLRATFEELFVVHEYGHRADDGLHVLDRVEAIAGIPRIEFVSPRFADAKRRSSWSRVASGSGTIADVLYQLGDLIANLVALERGATDEVWSAMRIFNWRFLLPDRPIRVPRGNAAILLGDSPAASYERGLNWLEDTIRSCRSADDAPGAFAAAEARAWSEVASVTSPRMA